MTSITKAVCFLPTMLYCKIKWLYQVIERKKHPPTKCLNSAARLPLVDSSMFITFVFVPKILNFLNLHKEREKM